MRESFNSNADTTLMVEGIFDSISTGILICEWHALVPVLLPLLLGLGLPNICQFTPPLTERMVAHPPKPLQLTQHAATPHPPTPADVVLVELINPLMTQSAWLRSRRWYVQAGAFLSFYSGITVMAVLGKWA